jgi:general secretion pathway protein A
MGEAFVEVMTAEGPVRVARGVLAALSDRAEAGYRKIAWGGVEMGGILLGRRGEADGVVWVEEWVEASCEHEFGPSFHLSARDLEALTGQLAGLDGARVVGWFLTSSRDLSLTPEAVSVADRYFFGAWQVGLVLLRGRQTGTRFSMYRGGPGRRVGTAGLEVAAVLAEVSGGLEESGTSRTLGSEPGGSLAGLEAHPPTEEFYASVQHREAVAVLERGMRARRGLMLLVGEAGTGKTMVLEALMGRLRESHAQFSHIQNPKLTVEELFEVLAYDLQLQAGNTRKVAVLYALQQRALERAAGGQTLGILVDDAHLLSEALLLELELLENIETRQGKLLQVVLSGRPALHQVMAAPGLLGLRQRVALQARVGPLDREEAQGYMEHRARRLGWDPATLWEPGFGDDLYRLTQGVPRLMNTLCEQVGDAAERRGERVWTRALLREMAG